MTAFDVYGETDIGRVRRGNEDSVDFFLNRDATAALAVVADGVGGEAGGDVASRLTTQTVRAHVLATLRNGMGMGSPECLKAAIEAAHAAVRRLRESEPRLARMATTVVAALANETGIAVAHAGDSRAYRWRDGSLAQLTRDDTVAQQMLDDGTLGDSPGSESPYQHILTRAVGACAGIEISARGFQTRPGDLWLLCSDGLTKCLDDETIAAVLALPSSLAARAKRLLDRANAAGGYDNIAVVLISTK